MSSSITAQWRQIAEWLRENAPLTFAKLNPAADERALAELASELNVDLPPDFEELLRNVNGSDHTRGVVGLTLLAPGYYMMDSARIVGDTKQRASIWRDAWLPTWIALGNDLCGGCLVLDAQPRPPHGRVFEFSEVDGPFGLAWDSLGDLLTEMHASLEGRAVSLAHRIPADYPRGPDPLTAVVNGGELEWERGMGERIPGPGR
jgi:cell wall assembly regulator SMI1